MDQIFKKKYGIEIKTKVSTDYMIDWPKISKEYGGVEIKDVWANKYEMLWIYGWDIPSGCIWDKRAIKIIDKIKIYD